MTKLNLDINQEKCKDYFGEIKDVQERYELISEALTNPGTKLGKKVSLVKESARKHFQEVNHSRGGPKNIPVGLSSLVPQIYYFLVAEEVTETLAEFDYGSYLKPVRLEEARLRQEQWNKVSSDLREIGKYL